MSNKVCDYRVLLIFTVLIASYFSINKDNSVHGDYAQERYISAAKLNNSNILKIKAGMSKAEVDKIMGTRPIVVLGSRIGNPYKKESIFLNNNIYLIIYYYTKLGLPDEMISENELTPVILENDKAIGRGYSFWQDKKLYEMIKEQVSNNASQSKYASKSKNNKTHGLGTFVFPDGSVYIGEFKNNIMHGLGTFTYSDGSKYIGAFKDNKMHGLGTITNPNGVGYEGRWKDGKMIKVFGSVK